MINLENLNVKFGKQPHIIHAVNDVSFRVPKGECYGLVGESGSGKSTVLRAIADHNRVASGIIEISGAAVGPKRSQAQLKQVQMVFQDPFGSLHPRHTINQIIKEPLVIQGFDNFEARIVQALEHVGLGSQFRFRYPHQLSGGQRQRVAIARALVLEPEVLLLDEPTSALDASVQAEILNLLTDLRETYKLTYLLVSHDLSVVGHMCNRISVMNRGRIVEEITDDQLYSGSVHHDYTRQLWLAGRGYDAKAVAEFQEFY